MTAIVDNTLEKSIRDSAATLLTSGLAVKVLDSWDVAEKSRFLELYKTSQWREMYGMLVSIAEGRSIRTLNVLCDIVAEVLEEQKREWPKQEATT